MEKSASKSTEIEVPNHANKIEFFHRRLFPFKRDNNNETKQLAKYIAKVRCRDFKMVRGKADFQTRVPLITVRNGICGDPPEACQGLSVMPCHPDNLMVEADIHDRISEPYNMINGKRIQRYFCYSVASSALTTTPYKVNYDKIDKHAHIYSPDECKLDAPVPCQSVEFMTETDYFDNTLKSSWKL